MRPLFLKLENFGPFLNESIDFKQIQTNQLFLISGKTGSGKTMIFDAIVYALYGRASTTSREVAQLRSHFASPELPLKVTYEFEIHQQRYKVIRTAAFTKPNKKVKQKGFLKFINTKIIKRYCLKVKSMQAINFYKNY
ncbi:AAA family ATPase [Staphylococcus chromogenes]|uniref:AAA family ATPase n=1 Tax=Staphylococcus chromogenes TaxID=46126 RepID=UPI000D02CAED|nr:AAA family ATPase [Staphylococcus chromogenes]